jgi:hypothetical protein
MGLESGKARRVLEDNPSTKGAIPPSAEGKLLQNSIGGFKYIYADQDEVSPGAKYYYHQPCQGGM